MFSYICEGQHYYFISGRSLKFLHPIPSWQLDRIYRERCLDYMENSVEEARPAFEASLTFWRENLPKLKELIAAGNPPRR
jgi:hypothetical protein